MIFSTQVVLLCASLLTLNGACLSVEGSRTAGNLTAHATPAPAVLPEPLSAEEQGDATLAIIRRSDRAARSSDGQLPLLPAEEHHRRATTYLTNRLFNDAREHWQRLISNYPTHTLVPAALFGTGRAYYVERRYTEALPFFERLAREYKSTKEGRDGFYYVAPTLLRMDRATEAARRYEEYTREFPTGERITDAYLNTIDTWREAGQSATAIEWVTRTRERFAGMPTAVNALFARLRLDVATGDWATAMRTSDELLRSASFERSVNTSVSEVQYLKAYSLEQAGQTAAAVSAYLTIPDRPDSYYGYLATERLKKLGAVANRQAISRESNRRVATLAAVSLYPAPYRDLILQATRTRNVDPRLMLAIMRQESSFRPNARSQAAARGLMQLTIDTAARYAPGAGLPTVSDEDLYKPETSILIAAEYLAELNRLVSNLPEAVAASYNGGEDNAVRWRRRAVHNDPGLFSAEVGFTETKDYVFKVMANYRAYQQLYTADLRRR